MGRLARRLNLGGGVYNRRLLPNARLAAPGQFTMIIKLIHLFFKKQTHECYYKHMDFVIVGVPHQWGDDGVKDGVTPLGLTPSYKVRILNITNSLKHSTLF